jgi:hypothetical protein
MLGFRRKGSSNFIAGVPTAELALDISRASLAAERFYRAIDEHRARYAEHWVAYCADGTISAASKNRDEVVAAVRKHNLRDIQLVFIEPSETIHVYVNGS